jgi:hypothetical protein
MSDITKRSEVGLYDVIVGPDGSLVTSGAQDNQFYTGPTAQQSNPVFGNREITFSGETIPSNIPSTNPTIPPVVTVWQQPGGATGGVVPKGTDTSGRAKLPVPTAAPPLVKIGTSSSNSAIVPTQGKIWDYQPGDIVDRTNPNVLGSGKFRVDADGNFKKIEDEKYVSNVIKSDIDGDGFDDKTGLNVYGETKEEVKTNALRDAQLAEGTDSSLIEPFKWETEGKTAAQIAAEQNILKAEQGALTARSKLMEQGEQGQATLDMEKYIRAQSAEKAGWTGGYRLDQNRQMDYLKASIQASMYNAQEMQRYGFDSQLSAARLAYEQGKQQLALEYYNTAVTQAMNEAQLTGVYFSPEQKDMLTQYNTAESILKNAAPGTDEFKRAAQIMNTIDEWFSANGLSKTGTKTLAGIQASITQANAEQSKLTSAIKTIEEQADGSVPLKDSNGKYLWNAEGTALVTFNPKTATAKDVYDFYSGKLVIDGKTITSGRGILNTTLQNEGRKAINTWFTSLNTTEQGLSSNELAANLVNYLNSKGINPISNYISSIESGANAALNLQDLIGSYGTLKGNMLEVKYTTGTGKTITVQFPTKGGAVRVGPAGGALGEDRPGIDVSRFNLKDINDSPVQSIVPADTYNSFIGLNPDTLYYRTSYANTGQPVNIPLTFAMIKSSSFDARLNGQDKINRVSGQKVTTASQLTNRGWTKLFSETFDKQTYDYYGQPNTAGELELVRIKV